MSQELETNGTDVQEGAPDWVVTFGDLMSLLLCFFVLLLSFSEVDRQKYKMVAGSMAKAFGVQRQDKVFDSPKGTKMIAMNFDQDFVPHQKREEFVKTQAVETVGEEIKKELQQQLEGLENKIEIEVMGHQTTIRLTGETTFDSGQSEIKPQLKPLLGEIGNRLKGTNGDLIIAGHTDNVPVNGIRFKSNLQLSIARAAEVAEFMINQVNIDPSRISTMGFGKYRPIDTNDTAGGRERNRRVEIILTEPSETVDSSPPKNS